MKSQFMCVTQIRGDLSIDPFGMGMKSDTYQINEILQTNQYACVEPYFVRHCTIDIIT